VKRKGTPKKKQKLLEKNQSSFINVLGVLQKKKDLVKVGELYGQTSYPFWGKKLSTRKNKGGKPIHKELKIVWGPGKARLAGQGKNWGKGVQKIEKVQPIGYKNQKKISARKD